MYPLRSLFLFLLFVAFGLVADAQISLETFGKNRVQRRTMDWRYFESKRFRVYYYDRAGAELARFVTEQADQDVKAIERTLNNNFPLMLNIVLYNNYDEYLQSNIDYNTELEISDPFAGNVKIVGDKLVIYFTGKHQDLKKQLRKGMAQVIMEHLLFGDDVKSFAKNAFAQSIPQWLSNGYVEYTVFGWDSDAEEEWKQYLNQKDAYFEILSQKNPDLAGKAFWKYISDRYGKQEVKNLFYFILQKNRLHAALKSKYQLSQNQMNDSIIAFYKTRYEQERLLTDTLVAEEALFTIKPANNQVEVSQMKVSPRGFDIAYVEWENGEYRVVLEKTQNQKQTKERTRGVIHKGGVKDFTAAADINYPLLAWSNTGFKLGIIYPKKGKLYFRLYDAIKGKYFNYIIHSNRFDRIQGFTFMEDDEMIVVSALKNGQSDLYEYRYRFGRFTQLTDDTYDDLSPVFISGGARKGIAFLSNRPLPLMNIKALPNELPTHPVNAYFYNYTTKDPKLLQLTKVKDENIKQIIPYGPDYFAYLSDKSGIFNRYIVLFARDENNMDTAYSVPVTNYSNNILEQQYNAASGKIGEALQDGSTYKLYFRKIAYPAPIGDLEIKTPLPIKAIEDESKSNQEEANQSSPYQFEIKSGDDFLTSFEPDTKDTQQVLIRKESADFADQMNLDKNKNTDTTRNFVLTEDKTLEGKRILYVDSSYIKMRSNPYKRAFHISSFSAHLDNALIFDRYQSYSGNFGTFNNPEVGGMFTMVMKDRMEDHRLTGGIKLNPDFTMSYLAKYENLRRRLDWSTTLYLQNQNFSTTVGIITGSGIIPTSIPTRSKMKIFQTEFNYPLDRTNSLRATLSLREDRTTLKASEYVGLIIPDLMERYVMNRFEFIHDDTKAPALNIFNGMRYKFFAEYMYKFQVENENYADPNGTVNKKLGGFYNFGFDFRYYYPIYRNFIFAMRVAGAHSGGSQQIMYALGGVDNAFNPGYNSLLRPTLKNTYAFQSLVTNMRGYQQNSRNGNTYFVSNFELRMPVVSTLTHKSVPSKLLSNFQLIGFVDIGSAWEGLLPDDNTQRVNTFYYPNPFDPTVVVTVPYPNPNQLAVSYGLGARLYMYSYFVRVDYGWTIERSGQLHVSLGYDF